MDDALILDRAVSIFFKTNLTQAVYSTFCNLSQLFGFTNGDEPPDLAAQVELKTQELTQACTELFNELRRNNRC